MKSRRILVACATELLPSLATYLAVTGCRLQFATSALELLRKARRRLPDLIILDGVLPDMDVTTVCEILSRLPSTSTVPRLRLALRKGAFSEVGPMMATDDDRPAPPFNPQELLSRVTEILDDSALYSVEMAGQDAA